MSADVRDGERQVCILIVDCVILESLAPSSARGRKSGDWRDTDKLSGYNDKGYNDIWV